MSELHYPHISKTQRGELWRSLFMSPMRAASMSGLFLLIALQYFNAPSDVKALIAAAPFIGLFLSPVLVYLVSRFGVSITRASSVVLFIAAPCMMFVTFSKSYISFVIGSVLCVLLTAAIPPLVTALWRQNIPTDVRGKKFSLVSWISMAAALVVGGFFAYWLKDISRYRPILFFISICLFLASVVTYRIPSQSLKHTNKHPFSALSLLWTDSLFGYVCVFWFFLGFANIATIPLRIEFVASGKYGMAYSPAMTLVLMQIIPQSANLVSMLIWGKLFDKLRFPILRMAINIFFVLSILLFFIPNLACQVAGSFIFGIATGGGFIAWNLWVTKIAPHDKTADYMSVHTCLCGFRGIVAPFLAYHFLRGFEIYTIAWTCAGLIIIATIMFIPTINSKRFACTQEN